MKARRKQAENLKSSVVERILERTKAQTHLMGTPLMRESAQLRVEALLQMLFDKACSTSCAVKTKRESLGLIRTLHRELDDASKVSENLVNVPTKPSSKMSNGSKAPKSASTLTTSQKEPPKKPLATVSKSTAPTKPPGSAAASSITTTSKNTTSIASIAASSASTSQIAASSLNGGVATPVTTGASAGARGMTTSQAAAASKAAAPPYKRHSDLVPDKQATKKRKTTAVSASDDTATPDDGNNDDDDKQQQNTPQNNFPKRPPLIEPIRSLHGTVQSQSAGKWVDFPADDFDKQQASSRYSAVRVPRPAVGLYFNLHWPENTLIVNGGKMFEQWEPFWQVENVIIAGVTSPVTSRRWAKPPSWRSDSAQKNEPNTVVTFHLPKFKGEELRNIAWGTAKIHQSPDVRPKEGDIAVVMRMLPVLKRSDRNKPKRAPCHLWPKGTFMMINGTPVQLAQRRQTSHDATKWEQMSYPLDVSSHIRKPTDKTVITLCCQDETQYLFVVAVCSYKPPGRLLRDILEDESSCLVRLTLEESKNKAMQYINKNSMISIDDDEGDNGKNGTQKAVPKLVFSLVDPVTKVPMTTPVRGRQCKHWQVSGIPGGLAMYCFYAGSAKCGLTIPPTPVWLVF